MSKIKAIGKSTQSLLRAELIRTDEKYIRKDKNNENDKQNL